MQLLATGDTVAVTHDHLGRIITLSSDHILATYDQGLQLTSEETTGWSHHSFGEGELQYREGSLFAWFSNLPFGLRHIAYRILSDTSWTRVFPSHSCHLINPTPSHPDGVSLEGSFDSTFSQMPPRNRYWERPQAIHLAGQHFLCLSRMHDLTMRALDGTRIYTIAPSGKLPHNSPGSVLRTTLLSPEGDTLYLLTRQTIAAVSVKENGTVRVAKYLPPHLYYVQQRPILSPDGRTLAIQMEGGPLLFLDPYSFRLKQSYDFQTRGLSFSPDGLTLAMATKDGTVVIDL